MVYLFFSSFAAAFFPQLPYGRSPGGLFRHLQRGFSSIFPRVFPNSRSRLYLCFLPNRPAPFLLRNSARLVWKHLYTGISIRFSQFCADSCSLFRSGSKPRTPQDPRPFRQPFLFPGACPLFQLPVAETFGLSKTEAERARSYIFFSSDVNFFR